MDTGNVALNVEDGLRYRSTEIVRAIQGHRSLGFTVCCLNVTKDLNVGMIIRTSAAFGARKVLILGRRKYDKRTTVGSHNFIKVERINTMSPFGDLDHQKIMEVLHPYTTIGVETRSDTSIDIVGVPWRALKNPCLVFGNEGDGIPTELLNEMNMVAHVPQPGVVRSLNVSNAAAIAIHEIYRGLIGDR